MVRAVGTAPNLSDLRLLSIALLSFSAFLRYDELAKLRCKDNSFLSDKMVIFISSSKADQFHG